MISYGEVDGRSSCIPEEARCCRSAYPSGKHQPPGNQAHHTQVDGEITSWYLYQQQNTLKYINNKTGTKQSDTTITLKQTLKHWIHVRVPWMKQQSSPRARCTSWWDFKGRQEHYPGSCRYQLLRAFPHVDVKLPQFWPSVWMKTLFRHISTTEIHKDSHHLALSEVIMHVKQKTPLK